MGLLTSGLTSGMPPEKAPVMISEKRKLFVFFFFVPAGRHVTSQMNFQQCSFGVKFMLL